MSEKKQEGRPVEQLRPLKNRPTTLPTSVLEFIALQKLLALRGEAAPQFEELVRRLATESAPPAELQKLWEQLVEYRNRAAGHSLALPHRESGQAADRDTVSLEQRVVVLERQRDQEFLRAENLRNENLRLREEVARANRLLDQLGATNERCVNQLVGHLNDRARANDNLVAIVSGTRGGELLVSESFEGVVAEVSDHSVVVVYETDSDEISQEYERAQFKDGRLPKRGDRLVIIAVISRAPESADAQHLPGDADDEGEVIRGDFEF